MQFNMDPITSGLFIGLLTSVVMIIILGIAYGVYQKVSSAALSYAIGALLAFNIGLLFVVGSTETPMHTWIGLLGGYFLFGMACIQSMFDLKKRETI